MQQSDETRFEDFVGLISGLYKEIQRIKTLRPLVTVPPQKSIRSSVKANCPCGEQFDF